MSPFYVALALLSAAVSTPDPFVEIVKALAWPFAFVAAVLLLKAFVRFLEYRRLAAAGMDEVDRMSGYEFEKFLEVVFKRLGYAVERTSYVGDWGGDLVFVKDGARTVVQAKRWKGKVGVRAVQEVVAAKGKYGCNDAMVVTNSTYTAQATELARANGVRLWDREDLIKARLEMRRETPQSAPEPAPLPDAPSGPASDQTALPETVCATCGEPVSEKVRRYCEDHAERFGGKVHCFACQKRVRRGVAQQPSFRP